MCIAGDVCFEPMDAGACEDKDLRWYFDSQNNTCTQFLFGGCAGNQNTFDSEETCNTVCPGEFNKSFTF